MKQNKKSSCAAHAYTFRMIFSSLALMLVVVGAGAVPFVQWERTLGGQTGYSVQQTKVSMPLIAPPLNEPVLAIKDTQQKSTPSFELFEAVFSVGVLFFILKKY